MKTATTQALIQVATAGRGEGASSQAVILVAYAPPGALKMKSTRAIVQAATEGLGKPSTSHAFMLVAYRTGAPGQLRTKAWSFVLDGHTFYVVNLGDEGTWVYDQTTGQWCRWVTAGHLQWNMHIGVTWNGRIIAADESDPILWELTPDKFLDNDFKPQVRVVTGGLAVRQRASIANYSFSLTASLGDPEVPTTAPPTVPKVNLSFSDDGGNTFFDAGGLTVVSDDFLQQLTWGSLGTMHAPGRIYKITDTGAIKRIDGADAEVGEEGE